MADSLASQIITAIGGPENVRSLTHCATRLRFELADASKVDQNALEHMKGVLGAVPQTGSRRTPAPHPACGHLPPRGKAPSGPPSREGEGFCV